jgi:hypothetical protein
MISQLDEALTSRYRSTLPIRVHCYLDDQQRRMEAFYQGSLEL